MYVCVQLKLFPSIFIFRNQVQMQMKNYNPNYNSYYSPPSFNSLPPPRWGSRRNSLKGYPAPPPPPMPPNMQSMSPMPSSNFYRSDGQQTNRSMQQQNMNMRNSYPPASSQNTVQELQNMMGNRGEYEVN